MERIRELSLKTFENILNKGYEINVINPENLAIIRDDPRTPAVLYFNHSSLDDPFLMVGLINSKADQRLNNVILPVSDYHAQYKNFPKYAISVQLGRALAGFHMPKLIQSYRVRSNLEGEEDQKKVKERSSHLAMRFLRDVKDKLPSGPLIIVSPEGHRSPTARLLPAENGIGAIAFLIHREAKKSDVQSGYFLPVGIVFEKYKGDGLNYNLKNKAKLDIIVGEPVNASDAISETAKLCNGSKMGSTEVSHYLMARLAGLLPEEMQGVYRPDLIKDTFSDRFELRMIKGKGTVVFDKFENKIFDLNS